MITKVRIAVTWTMDSIKLKVMLKVMLTIYVYYDEVYVSMCASEALLLR